MMFLSLGIGAAIAITMISVVSYFTKPHATTTTSTTTTVATSPLVGKKVGVRELPALASLPTVPAGTKTRVPVAGTPTIVVFFASWCGPCHEEMPRIASWYKTKPDGVSLILIASNDTAAAANSFLSEHHAALPAVLDSDGAVADTTYGFGTLPETVFIDATGKVRQVVFGAVTKAQLTNGAAALL